MPFLWSGVRFGRRPFSGARSGRRSTGTIAVAALLLLGACTTVRVPEGRVWLEHLHRDLEPFWTTPAALGEPVGNFPTFRCHDGSVYDASAPCPELAQAGSWIREHLGRNFVRMQSRQTYFYGAAYHLTGDPRMLELAKAGAAWLRTQTPEPTSQDLAYAQLGPAMLYYLTRDPALLPDLLAAKERIFRDRLPEEEHRELVAPLDQLNAYMLLLAPILPEPHRTEWRRDLVRLADGIISGYWNEGEGMFRGTSYEEKFYGSRHTDFGHTIKALWMIERVGRLAGRADLVEFGRKHAARVLERAMTDSGCWATGVRENGELDRGLVWWSFAELDQMAATLALSDRGAAKPLPDAYRCWFEKLVDPVHHEVWGFGDPGDATKRWAKAHLWKSGYHSAEHALVGYLTAQELHRRPAVLWFAFDATPETVRPYFFSGRVRRVERLPDGTRVTFDRLR